MNPLLGHLSALATAGCWAQNSVVYSFAGKRVGSRSVTHIRLWIALPVILLVNYLITGEAVPLDISSGSLLFLLLSGFIGFFMADLFIFRAFVELGPRETMVIMSLYPIISAVLSWLFLEEQLSLVQAAGIGVTICGVMWVTYVEAKPEAPGTKKEKRGLIFALLGAFTQSLAFILAKQGMIDADISPVTGNMLRVVAGFIGVVAYTMVTGRFIQDFRNMRDRKALLLISGGALVGPVLGMILTLYALSLAPVGIVTAIMQISPVILLPVDRFLFKKTIPSGAVFGTFLAVGGAALLFIFP